MELTVIYNFLLGLYSFKIGLAKFEFSLAMLCIIGGLIFIILLVEGDYKYLNRLDKNERYFEEHREIHEKGLNDGKVVDLSFFNTGQLPNNPDPEMPSKVIFDKNDRTGSLLFVLFPKSGEVSHVVINGKVYIGYTHSNFSVDTREAGTMERVNDNRYMISVVRPSDVIMSELARRNITVISGGSPLVSVKHNHLATTGSGNITYNRYTFTYIYASRRDAIGVFNPNDPTILPQ